MKRYIVLLLVLCLMLCACGKDKPVETTPTPSTQAQAPAETTPPTTVPAPTEPVEVLAYRHPLNGTPIAKPWSGQVVAVMINNLKAALPQCGISSADLYYEIEVEGDITRCLAVFSDVSQVREIGPIRSVRTVYNSIAASYDAPIIHCGGSPGLGLAGKYDVSGEVLPNWEHIDQGTNGSYFFRAGERYEKGYAWEHTLFTTGEMLQQALVANKLNTPTDKEYGLQFSEDVVLAGSDASEVTVKFKGGKTTTLKYDAATGRYSLYQYNQDIIDSNNGNVVSFKNVIAIYANQKYAYDGVHKLYETIGSGEGYAAINGKIVPIIWNRPDVNGPFTYTLADGSPLTLDVGSTYVAVVGIKHPITYK